MSLQKVRLQTLIAAAALATLTSCGIFQRQTELDCMERAMYFESNRSSRDGMIAVGSVVMNRVNSGDYPKTVCGVVGQKRQFAPGIMSRKMDGRSASIVREAAVSVLGGERHPLIASAQFFHAATFHAPYNNIHYVLSTGGNAFYERRASERVTQRTPLPQLEGITGR
jgi:spore germination cell wall hydrolase CwlJ-like protein